MIIGKTQLTIEASRILTIFIIEQSYCIYIYPLSNGSLLHSDSL